MGVERGKGIGLFLLSIAICCWASGFDWEERIETENSMYEKVIVRKRDITQLPNYVGGPSFSGVPTYEAQYQYLRDQHKARKALEENNG